MRTLILGGVKSGKSSYALFLAEAFPAPRRFLATAMAFDEEMQDKIARHRTERGDRFETVEEALDIHKQLADRMILDCIPLWLNNMLHYGREDDVARVLDTLIDGLPANIVIVTNEVGMGFIAVDPLSRRYGSLLGQINARLASVCDRVVLMMAGIPFDIKRPA